VTDEQSPAPAVQWTAEIAVTPQFAADLIREQFPELGAQQVTVLATGWDNTACVVDGRWLFRFPHRELAGSGLPDSRRAGAAASVGHFLRILHDPALVALVDGADLPVDPMRRASADRPISVRAGVAAADRW
jgi:hypothetical protein